MSNNENISVTKATQYVVLGLMEFLENCEKGSDAYNIGEKVLGLIVNDKIILVKNEEE